MRKRTYMIFTVAVMVVLLFFSGCSNIGKPSSADLKKAVEEHCWLWGSGASMVKDGTVKVVSVKKIDSKITKLFGEELYVIDFEAEAEYLKPAAVLYSGRKIKVGQREKRRGHAIYEKWESGWRLQVHRMCD